MPRTNDLEMVRGDTSSWRLTFSRAGSPINLVPGTLIWMTAKRDLTEADAAAVFKKAIGTGVTIVDAATGQVDVDLLNTDTQPLLDHDYQLFFDVQLKELSGRITTFRAKLAVACDVTELLV